MSEVEEIYLPLSRLLSLYVAATQRLFRAQQGFLGTEDAKVPYIIGVARLGRGRQVDHRARAAGAAGALAERAQGRSHHHRRLSLSQRGARARRPDGEKGLSGELRPAGAAALPVRNQGRPAPGARAGLLAPHLRRDSEPVDRDRPARHPDRRGPQRAAGRRVCPRTARRCPSSPTSSISRSISMPTRTCCCRGTSTASRPCAAPPSAIRSRTFHRYAQAVRRGSDRHRDLDLDPHQPGQSAREHPADAASAPI